MPNNQAPFWKIKTLPELTRQEWESLCDGCGLCCLQKLEDRKTGRIDYTSVSCYLLDTKRCRCRSYENRMFLVRECLELTPAKVAEVSLASQNLCLPAAGCRQRALLVASSCFRGRRNRASGRYLRSGIGLISEEYVHPDDIESYIVSGLERLSE